MTLLPITTGPMNGEENVSRIEPVTPVPNASLALATGVGLIAAVIGALLWAMVTVTTNFQIGFMAIAIGFLVGYAVRFGRGTTTIFGVVGAVLALLGCMLGNVFSLVGFFARQENIGVLTALGAIDYAKIPSIIAASFRPMDLLFYGIAVYEGYRFSLAKTRDAPSTSPPSP